MDTLQQEHPCKHRNKKKILAISLSATVVLLTAILIVILYHFLGYPTVVGEQKYDYTVKETHVVYDGINLFGEALIPQDSTRKKLPTLIYAHGAESSYNADMSTLKSLAMSGIACYTFDFYGWSDKSTGPDGKGKFMRGKGYEEFVLNETKDLNAVISKVETMDFVDTNNLFLMGCSMGGCVSALTAEKHSDDLRALILQYPAINLAPKAQVAGSEYDVTAYKGNVLILQGTADTIVPWKMSYNLCNYYNTTRSDHAQMITYYGQPHVFKGHFKEIAARDTYNFIQANKKK